MHISDKMVGYYTYTGATLYNLMALGLRQDEASKFMKFLGERGTLVQDAVPGALREYLERLIALGYR